MASGLSIVIDTRNAELNIKNLNQALERLETQGNSVANMMRNLGGANPFAGLNAAVNITKAEFNALATSANLVKTTTKEMGDALVYAKTTLTGAATAATTFQAAMRGIGNSLNTAQAAMARFNQSGQSIATVLNSMNGANGSNGVNNLNNAIKQLNPTVAALNNETKAVNASLRTFSSTAIAAETAALKLDVALLAARVNMSALATATVATNATLVGLQGIFARLQAQVTGLSTSLTGLNRGLANIPPANNAATNSTVMFQRSAQGLEATLMRLQTLMTGGLFGMAALSIAKTADAMQGLENQVRLVTQGEEQREEVQRRLLVIANKNYSDIEAVTGSYQRNAFALAQLGKSQMDVLNFTDALSLAMRTGGRSMLEQKSAVYQLSQAMGAGKLMGDEFRSISENAPILLRYIAKEMGVAQGALKKLSSEGKITSEIIYNAMMKARPEMEKMAQSLPITMSQAWQQVNNSYKTFVDNFMNGTRGMSQGIASMLQGVGENFDTVIKGMTIAGGLAFVGFASKIDIATKSMALFNFVANANPFVRMATIILAVSSAFYGLDDVINTTSVIMGDLIHMITDGWTGIFNLIGDGLNSLQGVVAQNNDDIGKSYKDMFTNATTDHDKFIANATFASNNLVKTISTDNMKNEQSYFGFYSRTQKGFLGFVEFVGTAVIAAVSTLGGFFKFIFNGIEDTLKRMGNALMTAEEWIQKKLGNNVQHKRYDTFNNLSADQSYADVNSAGQKWWQDNFIMPLSGQVRQKEIATGGIPQSMYAPIDPNAKPPSSSDINDKKKKAHDLLKGEIADAIQWAAADLKIRPNDLAAVISFETSGTFSPAAKNPNSSATGLIQFMADKYTAYGYSRNEFAALGANEQMKYVVQYLKGRGIKQGSGLGDIYDAVAGYGYRRGSKAYELNRKWDANRDGYVAKGEAVTARAFQPHIKNYFPNGINLQDVGKVETDLAKNQAALDKAREDYIASIATGEAKINAQLNKAIADLPSKGFSGQALEDEKKRLTEEAEFDRLLFRETNRQKLDELMAVHKTKKDQILDESYLQGLTIAADESKSREQRKTELEALDVGTKEKIRLNDIANKHELNQIYAYRKTSSELIADEWDEKIDALRQYTGEYKEEWRKAYEEQKQRALDADKLQLNQQLLSLNEYKYSSFAFIDERLKLELDAIAQSTDAEILKQAKIVDAKKKAEKDKKDAKAKQRATQSGLNGDLFGSDNAAFRMDDELLTNNLNRDDRLNMAADKYMNGQSSYADYLKQFENITLAHTLRQRQIWLDGYGGMFGELTSIVGAFAGEQSKAYRVMFAIEKSFAIAKAALNIQAALASAEASMPFPANLPVIARVITEGAAIASNIKAINPKGFSTGGYTGNMGVNDIAGVVHGKEYVVNARNTVKYRDTLEQMNRGTYKEGGNVQVNNYAGVAVTAKQENGLTIVDVRNEFERQMKTQMTNPNSSISKSIYRNSTARPQRG